MALKKEICVQCYKKSSKEMDIENWKNGFVHCFVEKKQNITSLFKNIAENPSHNCPYFFEQVKED
jgi:hypothetical protein